MSDRVFPALSELNQEAYLRLKLALNLGLRRQVFVAVCDDLALRNDLAARLHADLAHAVPTLAVLPSLDGTPTTIVVGSPSPNGTAPPALQPLISLELDLGNPNPIAQITKWIKHATKNNQLHNGDPLPSFQVLGIEGLTRKSAGIQKRFLDHLQHIGNHRTIPDSSLILWLTRPWFRMVQLSAPAFWQAHTALFQFDGDPTPAPAVASARLSQPGQPPQSHPQGPHQNNAPTHAIPPTVPPVSTSPAAPPAQSGARRRALWELLADDLEQFDEPIQPADLQEFEEPLLHFDNARDRVLDVAPILMSDTGFVPPIYTTPPLESGYEMATEPRNGNAHRPTDHLTDSASRGTPDNTQTQRDRAATPTIAVTPPPLDRAATETEITPADTAVGLDTDIASAVTSPTPNPQAHPAPNREWVEMVRTSATTLAHPLAPEIQAEIWQTLDKIEQGHHQGASPADLATAYRHIGNLYRDAIEQGNTSEGNLLITLHTYEQTLGWLEETSPQWADVLNDVGNLYWMLSRQVSGPEVIQLYLEQGIAAYALALTHIDPQTQAQSYAMLQNNLGSAYGDLARYQNPAAALQQAVQAYAESLRYRNPEDDPARYAATQNNLGTAYWNLAQHEQPIARLKQAIAAYLEALSYYSPEREPLHYAMIQNNLGTAYWNLAQQISPPQKSTPQQSAPPKIASDSMTARELLLHAINAYRDALTYRTLESAPSAYAATQNNLGTAFWNLATLPDTESEVKQEALALAITAYTNALATVQQLAQQSQDSLLTFDRYATHNNLGLAHYHLATAKQSPLDAPTRSHHLETALQQHLQALQGWTHQPDYSKTVTSYIVQTVRAFYTHFGMKGQSIALSQIPAALLPELMPKL
jgi:tetratricopeptide (TPR) repeat protein